LANSVLVGFGSITITHAFAFFLPLLKLVLWNVASNVLQYMILTAA